MKLLCLAVVVALAAAKPEEKMVEGEYIFYLNAGVTMASMPSLLGGKVTSEM